MNSETNMDWRGLAAGVFLICCAAALGSYLGRVVGRVVGCVW
jgi:hypothetical protein